jgi:uncharacterized protein involved in outer membrane biogenesis
MGQLLGRQVFLERVRTNPFALSIKIDGFRIQDSDGSDLLSWNHLYVNTELWPLLKKRLDFKAIDLDQPRFRVSMGKGGRLNFSDILERFSKDPKPNPSQDPPMVLTVGHFRVGQAQLSFTDHSLPQPFSSTLGPITIDLKHFTTEHDARSPYLLQGRTETGEGFTWSGKMGTEPLKASGTLELSGLRLLKYAPYYQDQVAFRLASGMATVKASYDFEWSESRHVMRIMDGSLALSDLALHEKDRNDPSVRLPAVEATGIQTDLLQSRTDVDSLTIKDGNVRVRKDPDGRLNLETMFIRIPDPNKPKTDEFKIHVKAIGLRNLGIKYEDLASTRPVSLTMDQIDATLRDFNLDPVHRSSLELAMRIGEKGTLQARGALAPFKTDGELDIKLDGLDLTPLDAYLDSVADARFSRGTLDLDGRIKFAFEGRKDDGMAYQGDLQISDFEVRDAIQNEPFLRWKRLRLVGTNYASQRPSLSLKRVEWTQPEARLVMAKDGNSNVARAFRLTPTGPAGAAVPPTPSQGPEPILRIARLGITGGRLSFIDRSVEPNAALLLSEMEGVYSGLSTEAEEATQADFKGKAGGFAPITIKGKAMPLRHDKDTDVSIKVIGADLTDFSPYTGKYLGYTTRQGKMDIDARVRIQDRKLNIEDKVRLDRWYLGDKVESPDATQLPVKLGLAILRDRKGLIELEIPVDGSLDDPDIHYGKMVWKAILNVFGKIITSPFTLLSNVFGSGNEDLSFIAFAPGASAIPASEHTKLETMVKALTERPELRLEIEATADAQDSAVLKRHGLETVLKRLKWNAKKVKSPITPEEETIEPGEREQWVRTAYDAAFPPPKGVKIEPPPVAEMELRLLDTIPIGTNELRALEDARNRASLTALLQNGQVAPDRIFVVQGSEAARAGGPKAHFTIK